MRYWFIIHDLEAFKQHPDMIGCKVKGPGIRTAWYGPFNKITKGDKIVYYATGDKVVVGIFDIISDAEYLQNDPDWGEIMIHNIKPDIVPPRGKYLDFKSLIRDPQMNFDLFPEKDKWMYQLWGHTCRPLTNKDFELIKNRILKLRREPSKGVSITEERIGIPLGGDLLFAPIDESGVICLFSKYHKNLGFPYIKKIGSAFPDAEVIDSNGKNKFVEFEFLSSNYKLHGHDKESKQCDFIICWEHDWSDMPTDLENKIEIIPLKDALSDILGR